MAHRAGRLAGTGADRSGSLGGRGRRTRQGSTIAELAGQEGRLALPAAAFPAQLTVERVVGRSALVAFEGHRSSVSPGLVGQTVTIAARLGELHQEILSAAGRRITRHRRAPAGAGQLLRLGEHPRLLKQTVLDAFTTDKPCRRKPNRPPGKTALTQAARLRGHDQGAVVVDHEHYAQSAEVAR